MICPFCHGTRWVTRDGRVSPCPECGGAGDASCSDAAVEQIDPAETPVVGPTTNTDPPHPAAPPGRAPQDRPG